MSKTHESLTMRLYALIPAVLALSACVSQSTILTNQKGQWVRCSASGGGWLGAPMAANNHSRCVEDFEKLGYLPVPDVVWGLKVDSWQSAQIKVSEVSPDSPAAAAGIMVGDLIKTIDDQPVANGKEIFKLLAKKAPGESIKADVERAGVVVSTNSTLLKRK